MKRPALSQVISSFLLLMLFSLFASAARLEVDRAEIAVGEITTVHLRGTPFLVIADWKTSPELEIVDSNNKGARIRGLRAGTGKVFCDMNLKPLTTSITVRGAAVTAPATPPAYVAPAYTPPPASAPAYTQPAYTPPAYPVAAPAAASSQSSLVGSWQIEANGYPGKLEIASAQGMLTGRVWFDSHATWEALEDLYFDEAISELSFSRPAANQAYRGRLRDKRLEGMFTQWGGRDYSAVAPTYPWFASQAGAMPMKPVMPPASRPARIDDFTWLGMNEDQVGDGGNGRPNGTPDGHFRLAVDFPGRLAVTSISLWSANDKGDKAGGQIWHSQNGSYWMLGVFRDGRQINASHVASLGEFSGRVVFDLYANSSGWFNPGQTFLVEMETRDGKVARQILRLGAAQANLARGKPASQSSTSQWSRANDAQGAVDGIINGGYSFHTDHQANPWWQVDLGANYRLSEVRLYNRLDCCSERARSVQVMLSDDGRNWRTVYRHHGGVFGGKDGKPLVVAMNGESARHVRLQLNETNWFHLDEVEVMGAGESASGGGASLRLSRDRYAPGETIVVDFTAPASYASDAWVGIIPSHIPHGSEAENDRHDITYQYLQKRASGSMTFTAPAAPGGYDLRLHDTDNNGREVASVSFQVGAALYDGGRGYTADGGRGYTAQNPGARQSDAPGGDDSLKDVVNQLKGIFGR